ncbi:MAG: P-loop NTPase [Candidatus Nanohaloarchaea archaeon]|nr:P-loop NTPase [Candidatus Nanohaloarchaea archaeon]
MVSGKGGVGKTVVTLNLATAMRQLGEDVIVIDSDARRQQDRAPRHPYIPLSRRNRQRRGTGLQHAPPGIHRPRRLPTRLRTPHTACHGDLRPAHLCHHPRTPRRHRYLQALPGSQAERQRLPRRHRQHVPR